MVSVLREIYAKSKHPSHDDKESAAQTLASIIEHAQAIGHTYAQGQQQRSIAWGDKFTNALNSAWSIVNNFVQRIAEWFTKQESSGADITEQDITDKIDSLAEQVADVEVHAAIEQEVWETLYFAGVKMMRSVAQPGACEACQDKADEGAVPIDDFEPPPYHSRCRCNGESADDDDE